MKKQQKSMQNIPYFRQKKRILVSKFMFLIDAFSVLLEENGKKQMQSAAAIVYFLCILRIFYVYLH